MQRRTRRPGLAAEVNKFNNVPYSPHGCSLDREGSRHSIYHNPQNTRSVAVPRHREIKATTARTICEQLGIPRPA